MLNKRARAIIEGITAQDLMDHINRPDSVKHQVELLIEKFDREITQSLSEKKFKESLTLLIEFVKLWEEQVSNEETKGFFTGIRAVIRMHYHEHFCKLDKRFRPVAATYHFSLYKKPTVLVSLERYRHCLEFLLLKEEPIFDEEGTSQILNLYKEQLEKDKTPWVYKRTLGID